MSRKKKPYDGSYIDRILDNPAIVAQFISKAFKAWGGDFLDFEKRHLGAQLQPAASAVLYGLKQSIADVFGMNTGTGNTSLAAFDYAIANIAKGNLPPGSSIGKTQLTAVGYTAFVAWQSIIDPTKVGEIDPAETGFKTLQDAANFVLEINGTNADKVLSQRLR